MNYFARILFHHMISRSINGFSRYLNSRTSHCFSMRNLFVRERNTYFKSSFSFDIVSLFLMLLIFYYIPISPSYGQEAKGNNALLQEQAVKVFLDVPRWDQDYIKTEIDFVNYVRDRKEAQVHIMILEQRTGSGGTEHTLIFTGQLNYIGLDDTLTFISNQMDTEYNSRV